MATMPAPTQLAAPGALITTPATAALSSQTFTNDGKTHVVVHNGGGSAVVLTEVVQAKYTADKGAALTIPNRTLSIPAGGYAYAGPFDPQTYNDANGEVTLQFDVTTSVTLQAFRH